MSLFLILLAATALRAYRLGAESLWLDEGYTYGIIIRPVKEILANHDVHPPLYFLMLHFWTRVVGTSEAALRSMSLVFGVATVAAVFSLARRLFGRETALWSAVFTALATFQINYSQEARSYSMMTFLTALSFLFFARILERPAVRDLAGSAASGILLVYAHIYGVFVLMAQNFFYFIERLRLRKKEGMGAWLVSQALVAAAFVPWLLVLKKQSANVKGNIWIEKPGLGSLLELFRQFSGGFKAFTLLALLAAWGFFHCLRDGRLRRNAWLLFVWVAFVIGAPFVISLLWTPVFYPRYLIAASLGFYILAAEGLTAVRVKPLKWLAAAALLFFFAASFVHYHAETRKEDWRETARILTTQARAGDALVLNSAKCTDILGYYFKRTDLDLLPFPKPEFVAPGLATEKSHQVTDEKLAALSLALEGHGRVWLLLSHSRDTQGRIASMLAERYRLVSEKRFINIRLLLFESS